MFYHFKGTITGEDYQRILGQMTKRMMLVFFRNYAYFFGY